MDLTSQSLLWRAQSGSEQAWSQILDLYRPFITRWLQRFHLDSHDVDDLCQDVLLTMVQQLPAFEHNGQPGAFRCWLRIVTTNRARAFFRSRGADPARHGDLEFCRVVSQLEQPDSEQTRKWGQEHDEHVLRSLLQTLSGEFEPSTLTTFRRLTLEGVPAQQLADELGISLGAVYVCKARVLRRLREEACELLG